MVVPMRYSKNQMMDVDEMRTVIREQVILRAESTFDYDSVLNIENGGVGINRTDGHGW